MFNWLKKQVDNPSQKRLNDSLCHFIIAGAAAELSNSLGSLWPTTVIDMDICKEDRDYITRQVINMLLEKAKNDDSYVKPSYKIKFSYCDIDYDTRQFSILPYEGTPVTLHNNTKLIDDLPDANELIKRDFESPQQRANLEAKIVHYIEERAIERHCDELEFPLSMDKYSRETISSLLSEKLVPKGYKYKISSICNDWIVHIWIRDMGLGETK